MNQQNAEPVTSPEPVVMEGVREYGEEYPVTVGMRTPTKCNKFKTPEEPRECVFATNEGGYNGVDIDLEDLVVWLAKNRRDLVLWAIHKTEQGGGESENRGVAIDEIYTPPSLPTTDEEAMRFIPEGFDAWFRTTLVGLYKSRRAHGDSIEKALEYTLLKGAGK